MHYEKLDDATDAARFYDQTTRDVTTTYDALHFLPINGFNAGGAHVNLRGHPIAVQTHYEAKKRLYKGNARSWKFILPVYRPDETLRYDLTRYHTFVRATNQVELLIKRRRYTPTRS